MFSVRVATDAELSSEVLGQIRALLEVAYGGDFSSEDWSHTQGGSRVIVFLEGAPVAHAAVVPRVIFVADRPFEAGYVEGVATMPEKRRQGLGSLVMTHVGELVVRTKFELGVLSTGERDFYTRFGWESWRGPSYVLDGPKRLRTRDEDAGLMVLRFGPSAGIDLKSPIACERRSGDDW